MYYKCRECYMKTDECVFVILFLLIVFTIVLFSIFNIVIGLRRNSKTITSDLLSKFYSPTNPNHWS